ncbi:MAG: laccase domain-containing protein, partial [Myxococcota bacterium]|nr:laccase domain-containing protein [Myxococcota bacterium]
MSGETVKLLRSDAPFPHAFTTRAGGVSTGRFETLNLAWRTGDDPANIIENHRRVAASLGYAPEDLAAVRQVHGARVVVV